MCVRVRVLRVSCFANQPESIVQLSFVSFFVRLLSMSLISKALCVCHSSPETQPELNGEPTTGGILLLTTTAGKNTKKKSGK